MKKLGIDLQIKTAHLEYRDCEYLCYCLQLN